MTLNNLKFNKTFRFSCNLIEGVETAKVYVYEDDKSSLVIKSKRYLTNTKLFEIIEMAKDRFYRDGTQIIETANFTTSFSLDPVE